MSGWQGRKVLVTGAGGFIGSHLVELLVAEGAEVVALVHYNSRNDWGNLEQLPADVRAAVHVTLGDVRDSHAVGRIVAGRETVFHLAALIGIPYSYVAPQSYVDVNITGTLNVLEAARAHDVERVVHTSTSETYGTALYTPIDERHPLQGQSPYSATKIGADKLVESYVRSFAVPATTLRPFNTFGPRQSLRAVIPTIAAQALSGNEVRIGSATPTRDLTFVTDTARAFLAVASSPNTVGNTYNAGSGESISIGRLAELVLDVLGSDATVVQDEARVRPPASEVGELVADATALRDATGWQPEVGLRDGLRLTCDWVAANLVRLKPHVYTV